MPELAQRLGHALASMKERFGQVPTVSRSDAVYTCAKPFGVIVLTAIGTHPPPSPRPQLGGNINAYTTTNPMRAMTRELINVPHVLAPVWHPVRIPFVEHTKIQFSMARGVQWQKICMVPPSPTMHFATITTIKIDNRHPVKKNEQTGTKQPYAPRPQYKTPYPTESMT